MSRRIGRDRSSVVGECGRAPNGREGVDVLDVAFSIENEAADELPRELTSITAENPIEAVIVSLRERLARERRCVTRRLTRCRDRAGSGRSPEPRSHPTATRSDTTNTAFPADLPENSEVPLCDDGDMDRGVWVEGVAELSRSHAPTPDVAVSTRLVRRARAVQLDEVGAAVDAGSFFSLGFRSPTDWLATTTREGVGACKITLRLADRIRHMPIVRQAFGAGDLAESALRLLADAWCEQVADVFARDEELLCRWATTLSHKDFGFVLDTWRLHADPDRADKTVEERYDQRSLHVSAMLDGMGRIDGTFDGEGSRWFAKRSAPCRNPATTTLARPRNVVPTGWSRWHASRWRTSSRSPDANAANPKWSRRSTTTTSSPTPAAAAWRPTSTARCCRRSRSDGSRVTHRCTGS